MTEANRSAASPQSRKEPPWTSTDARRSRESRKGEHRGKSDGEAAVGRG
jgi:hypothetical protein